MVSIIESILITIHDIDSNHAPSVNAVMWNSFPLSDPSKNWMRYEGGETRVLAHAPQAGNSTRAESSFFSQLRVRKFRPKATAGNQLIPRATTGKWWYHCRRVRSVVQIARLPERVSSSKTRDPFFRSLRCCAGKTFSRSTVNTLLCQKCKFDNR